MRLDPPPRHDALATLVVGPQRLLVADGPGGLGRIVYATSSQQLGGWLRELGVAAGPVRALAIGAVAPGIEVDGPAPELADRVKALHVRLHRV